MTDAVQRGPLSGFETPLIDIFFNLRDGPHESGGAYRHSDRAVRICGAADH